MIRRTTIFSLLVATTLTVSCKDTKEAAKPVTTEPITFEQEGEAYLVKPEGDTIQHLKLEIADDDYQRETGLMYRHSMEQDQAMLFIFEDEQPRGFYMKNTHIPLDLIFLDSQNKIVSISENAQPESMETIPSKVPAQYVLEVNAGLADQWGLSVGDSLIVNKD